MKTTIRLKAITMRTVPKIIALTVISAASFWACNKSRKQPPDQNSTHTQTVQEKIQQNDKQVEIRDQLESLQKFIDNGKPIEYFDTKGWKILFGELEEDKEIKDLKSGTLFFYQVKDVADPNGYIYVVSSASKPADITTENTLAAWAY
jgi:hypothetical protein